MAIYSLHIHPIARRAGRSSTAAAAYRACSKIYDQRTGEWHDYTRKRGLEHAEIVLSSAAAKQDINWARNRADLWNVAEAAENRRDSRVAREYLVALPHEFDPAQRLELVRRFSSELANRYQVAVDFAIHKPEKAGDQRNYHAHILTTTRAITATGLGRKTDIELGDRDRARKGLESNAHEFVRVRARWASLNNAFFAELGIGARIDHRSLEAQGIEREPRKHLGPALSGILERGEHSIVIERWDLEAQERLERAHERGLLEREKQGLESSILDLSMDLTAAVAARENAKGRSFGASLGAESRLEPERKPTLEEIRAKARENWASYRKAELEKGEEAVKDKDKEKEKGKEFGKGTGRDSPDDDFSL